MFAAIKLNDFQGVLLVRKLAMALTAICKMRNLITGKCYLTIGLTTWVLCNAFISAKVLFLHSSNLKHHLDLGIKKSYLSIERLSIIKKYCS